jgi:hypothetical protein
VDCDHGERAGAQPLDDRVAVRTRPRRLADREEGERTRVDDVARLERSDIVDASRMQPVDLRNLRDAHCGLVEHTVHAGRPARVRRNLRHEQQRPAHRART